MARIFQTGKTLGLWYWDLCDQRWVYWALMIWLLSRVWSGSLQSTINAHYWVAVCMATAVLLCIIGQLLRLCALVLARGEATMVQAVWVHLKRKWGSRPTLGAFLRGPR